MPLSGSGRRRARRGSHIWCAGKRSRYAHWAVGSDLAAPAFTHDCCNEPATGNTASRMRNLRAMFVSLLGGTLLAACGLCHNSPLSTARSPDGRFEATAFLRYCSGPTGYSTHVSILATGLALENEPGNVLNASGRHPFSVAWKGNNELIVYGVKGVHPERMFDHVGNIAITYIERDVPRPAPLPHAKTFRDRPHRQSGRSGR
jgi:hypothetical protein